MSYPNFGKVKTIVLPLVDTGANGITIDEYREKTGIDLRDIIAFDAPNGRIVFKTPALYLFENTPEFSENLGYKHVPAIAAPSSFSSKAQGSSSPAELMFGIESFPTVGGSAGGWFSLTVPIGRPLAYENVIVVCNEA